MKKRLITCLFALLILLPAAGLFADEQEPVRVPDIQQMFRNGSTTEEILLAMRDRGVGFSQSVSVERRLANWGFTDEQIGLIRRMQAGERVELPGDEERQAEEQAANNPPPAPGGGAPPPQFPVGFATSEEMIKTYGVLHEEMINKSRLPLAKLETERFTFYCSEQRMAELGPAMQNLDRQIAATFPPYLANPTHKQTVTLVLSDGPNDLNTLLTAMVQAYRNVWPDYGKHIGNRRMAYYISGNVGLVDGSIFKENDKALRPLAYALGYAMMSNLSEYKAPDAVSWGFANCIEQLAAGDPSMLVQFRAQIGEHDALGGWAEHAKQRYKGNRMPTIVDMLRFTTAQMQPTDQVAAWSLALHLQKRPEQLFNAILLIREGKTAPLDAFQQAYETDARTLNQQWHESIPGL